MTDTIEHSQVHSTFVIERSYPAPLADVWHALTDTDARAHWFGGGDAFDVSEQSHEFRVGGRAVEDGRWKDGPASRFEAVYTDIVDQHRAVFTYDMWIDGGHLSTSLTTIVVEPEGSGTRLTYTEQAVYFDGLDKGGDREAGCRELLENLGRYLDERLTA